MSIRADIALAPSSQHREGLYLPPVSSSNWTTEVSELASTRCGSLALLTPTSNRRNHDSTRTVGRCHDSADSFVVALLRTRLHGHLTPTSQGPL